MSEKLLPCPFCQDADGPPRVERDDRTPGWIVVSECSASIWAIKREDAITAWNTRPTPPDPREAIGLLSTAVASGDKGYDWLSTIRPMLVRALAALNPKEQK